MADLKDNECGCLVFRKPGAHNFESFPNFPIMYGDVVRIGSKDGDDIRITQDTDRKTCAILTIAKDTGFVEVSNPEGADTMLNDKLLTKNKYLIPEDALDIKGKVLIYRSDVLTKEDIDMLKARNTVTIRHVVKNRHSALPHKAFNKIEEDEPVQQQDTPVIVRKGFTFQTGYVRNITPSKTNFHGTPLLRLRRMSGDAPKTANSALEKRKSNLFRRRSMDITLKALASPFVSRKSSLANVRAVTSRPASDLISWVTPPSTCTPTQTPTKRRSSLRNSAILRSAMQTHNRMFSHVDESVEVDTERSTSQTNSEKDNSDIHMDLHEDMISKTPPLKNISDKGSFSPRTLKMMQISSPYIFEESQNRQSEKVRVQKGKIGYKRRSLSAPYTVPEPINRRRSIAAFESRSVFQTESLRRSLMRTEENFRRKSTRFTGSSGLEQVSVESKNLDFENSLDENRREFENESDKNKSTSQRKSVVPKPSLRRSTRSSTLQDKTDIVQGNTLEFDSSCAEKNISLNKTASLRKSRKSTSFLGSDSFKDPICLSSGNLNVEDKDVEVFPEEQTLKYDNSIKIEDVNISASKKSFSSSQTSFNLPKSRKSTRSSRPDNFLYRTYSSEVANEYLLDLPLHSKSLDVKISMEKTIGDNENVEMPYQRKSINRKSISMKCSSSAAEEESEHDESSNTIKGKLVKSRKSVRLSTRSATVEDRSYSSEIMPDEDQLEMSIESGNLNYENSLEGNQEHENEGLNREATSFDRPTTSSMAQYPINIHEHISKEQTVECDNLPNSRDTSLNLPKARKSLRTIRKSHNFQGYVNGDLIDDENQPELNLENSLQKIRKDTSTSTAHRSLSKSTRASVLKDLNNTDDVESEMLKFDDPRNISINKMTPLNVPTLRKSTNSDTLKEQSYLNENTPDENRVESSIEIRKLEFQNSLDQSTSQDQGENAATLNQLQSAGKRKSASRSSILSIDTPNILENSSLDESESLSEDQNTLIISVGDSDLTDGKKSLQKSSGRKSFKPFKSHITIEDSAIDSQTPSDEIRDSNVKMSVSRRSARLQKSAVDNVVDETVFDDNSTTPNELKRKQMENKELLTKMLTSTAQKGRRKSDMIFRQPMLTPIRSSVKRASESMFNSHNLVANQNFERPIQTNSFYSPIQNKSCSATFSQNESQEIESLEKLSMKASYEEIHGKYSTLSGSPVLDRLPSTSKKDSIELNKESFVDSFVPLYEDVTMDEEDADDEMEKPSRNALELSGVEQIQASPKSDSPNVSGLKHFFARRPSAVTPKVRGVKTLFTQKGPLNDLTNVEGVRDVLRVYTPLNDLTEVRGVKDVFRNSPSNDMRNVKGVKQLFDVNTPLNDLRHIEGVKETMRRNSPWNDLSDVAGVKRIFDANTPKNNLSDVEGMERLFKRHNTPNNDLRNVEGVKATMRKQSPYDNLSNVVGVKRIFDANTPNNDLSEVEGVRGLFKRQNTPKNNVQFIEDVKNVFKRQNTPRNDLTHIPSIKILYASEKVQNTPILTHTEMFKTPKVKQSNPPEISGSIDLFRQSEDEEAVPKGTPSQDAFDALVGRQSYKTYSSKLNINSPEHKHEMVNDNIAEPFESMKKKRKISRGLRTSIKDATEKSVLESLDLFQVKPNDHDSPVRTPTLKQTSTPLLQSSTRGRKRNLIIGTPDLKTPVTDKKTRARRNIKSTDEASKQFETEYEQPIVNRNKRNLRSKKGVQENDADEDKPKEFKGNETQEKSRSRRGATKIFGEEGDQIKEQPSLRRTRRNQRSEEVDQGNKNNDKIKKSENEEDESKEYSTHERTGRNLKTKENDGGSEVEDKIRRNLKSEMEQENENKDNIKESNDKQNESKQYSTHKRTGRNLKTKENDGENKVEDKIQDIVKKEDTSKESKGNEIEQKPRPRRGTLKISQEEKDKPKEQSTPRRTRRNLRSKEAEQEQDKGETKGKQNESEETQSEGDSSKVDVTQQDKPKGKLTQRTRRNPKSKEIETSQEKEENKTEEQPPTPRRNRRNLRTEKMEQEPKNDNESKPKDSEGNQVVEKRTRSRRGALKVVEKEEGAKEASTPRRNRRNIKTDEGGNDEAKSEETKEVENINEEQSTRMKSVRNLKQISTTTEKEKNQQEEITEPVIEQKLTRRGKKTLKTDTIESKQVSKDNRELKETKENLQEPTVESLESSEEDVVAHAKTRSRRTKKSEKTEVKQEKTFDENLPVKTRSLRGTKKDKNTEGDNPEVIKETPPEEVVTQKTRSQRVAKKTDDKEENKDQDIPEENVQQSSVELQKRPRGAKKVEKASQKGMGQAPKRSRRNLKDRGEHLENTNETSVGNDKENQSRSGRDAATKRKKIEDEESDWEEQEEKRPRRNLRFVVEEKCTREMRPRRK